MRKTILSALIAAGLLVALLNLPVLAQGITNFDTIWLSGDLRVADDATVIDDLTTRDLIASQQTSITVTYLPNNNPGTPGTVQVCALGGGSNIDLSNFLGDHPGQLIPCHECQVWLKDEFIAASFLESSHTAASSVYGLFEPAHSTRSLGIFTMLSEMQWALDHGLRYYYSGYATREPSHYDYKKNFAGLEIYDWADEGWVAYEEAPGDQGNL